MRDWYQHRGPWVSPADSSHVWVSWSWDWFHPHTHSYKACDTNGHVTLVVNEKARDIQLRYQTQSLVLVRADPCLKHDIKMQVSDSEGTAVTAYNSEKDKSLYSWRLYLTVSQRICLNNDNITVKILEPIEPLRNCIITRGDQELKKTSPTTGLVNLTIVNPDMNSNSEQPEKINITITVPVVGMKRCKSEADLTTTQPTSIHSDSEKESQIGSAATIAIPLLIVALIIVGLIAGYVFHRKRNQKLEMETVDENPVYGEEMYEQDGNVRQYTAEVIDSSPDYGESTEGWDGAYITDTNDYYA